MRLPTSIGVVWLLMSIIASESLEYPTTYAYEPETVTDCAPPIYVALLVAPTSVGLSTFPVSVVLPRLSIVA